MAGIIAVYSLVIAVLIAGELDPGKAYSLFEYVYHISRGLRWRVGGQRKKLKRTQGFHASWCWSFCGSNRSRGRLCDWDSRRRGELPTGPVRTSRLTLLLGCSIVHVTVTHICRHGLDSHIWRGARTLWVRVNSTRCGTGTDSPQSHRRSHHEHKKRIEKDSCFDNIDAWQRT